jgi:PAB1-binding protein PBP1
MLTQPQKDDLAHIVLATMQIQSAIHTLDKVTGEGNKFKQLKKKEWNQFIYTVQKFTAKHEIELYELTAKLIDQSQNYIDCVNEFDKVAEEMQIILP